MSAPTNLKEFCALLVRSKLMTPEEVKDVAKHFQSSGKAPEDLDAFRKLLFTNRYLTEYQLALLSRGHSEGFHLDQYKILDVISKGNMAGVYKAIHQSGQTVAIKVLPASKAKDPEALARFRREARLITKLDHPNMVRAFQLGESANKNYLVMEYLEGETLAEILAERKKLPPIEAVRIAQQVMIGLQHLHERGMIHRDINPNNIMLLDTGSTRKQQDTLDRPIKILDIGLGKSVFDENVKSTVDDPSQLTSEGVLLGSPEYLSPEQARKASSADIRSDIYSVGCILFHMLVGEPPFPDKSILNQVMRHATEPPRQLADLIHSVPDGLQNVLNFMIAKDPSERYSTPEKASQALQLLFRNLPSIVRGPAPMPEYLKWLRETGTEDTSEFPASVPPKAVESPPTVNSPPPANVITPPTVTPVPIPPTPVVKTMLGSAVTPTASIPVGKLDTGVKKTEPLKKGAVKPALPVANISEDYDVELIDVPPAKKLPSIDAEESENRGLFELNRRDVIMMSFGGAMVVTAILGGYGLSKLFRRPSPSELNQNPPETESPTQE